MKVLIVFATVEGQTAKIARFIEGEVQKAGHEAVLFDAGDTRTVIAFEGVDMVVLAAPVHERRHPQEFEALLAGRARDLAEANTLLISVSLSAAFAEGMEDAADYLTELKMRTGLTPDAELLVAGAVRTGSYDYFASQVVRHVVLRGRDADPAEEHEFTDWDALAAGVAEFLSAGGPE